MGENVLRTKSLGFAIRIVRLFQYLQTEKKEYVLAKQALRSGTAVGAMIREAEYVESKTDFIHKTAIAQKEINETLYWLELLTATDYPTPEHTRTIHADALELLKLLISTLKTAKNSLPAKTSPARTFPN